MRPIPAEPGKNIGNSDSLPSLKRNILSSSVSKGNDMATKECIEDRQIGHKCVLLHTKDLMHFINFGVNLVSRLYFRV